MTGSEPADTGASQTVGFPEVEKAAQQAATDPTLNQPPANAGEDPAFPAGSWEENYRGEINKNMVADRKMRWWAFRGACAVALAFFVLLISAFCSIVFDNYLFKVVDAAASSGMQWHVLVFLGIVMLLCAAIPLSLSLAIVKMITTKESDEIEVKTATSEFAKVIYDLLKWSLSKHG